jgi:hypothetical protein
MELKHGAYAFMTGTVTDIFQGDKGLILKLDMIDDYANTTQQFTVFGLTNYAAAKGDTIKFKGFLKFSTSEKYGFQISMSKPQVVEHQHLVQGKPAERAVAETWESEAPF